MEPHDDPPRQPASASRRPDGSEAFLDQPLVRGGLAVISLGVFAVSIVVAIMALNNIVSVWFEYQYRDIARAILSGALAAASLAALWFVSRPPARR